MFKAEIPLRRESLHANRTFQRRGMPGPAPPIGYVIFPPFCVTLC